MRLEDLADELDVPLIELKKLLRKHFPDASDFSSNGLTLAPEHIRFARANMREFLRDRRARPSESKPEEQKHELPASVAALSSVARRTTTDTPREGGEFRLLLHLDLLDYLDDPKKPRSLKEAVLRRLRELFVKGRGIGRPKSTKGTNAGWLRASLGDNGGSHFYLWYAQPGQKPVKGLGLQPSDILVRAVRHHDATSWPIGVGTLDDYLPQTVAQYVDDVERRTMDADPLSPEQRRAFSSDHLVTITQGHPGAGKTTVELERARRYHGTVLFATFGRDQAGYVEKFMTTFAADDLQVKVRTVEDVLAQLDPRWKAPLPRAAARTLLESALSKVPWWGPWRGFSDALYAELRAHFYGRGLPFTFRGQPAVMDENHRKERPEAYLRRRERSPLGREAAQAAASLAQALAGTPEEAALFGDQIVARDLAERLHRNGYTSIPVELRGLSAVFIDEVQDLTLLETLVFALLVRTLAEQQGAALGFHVAGDEGQTIRATDFDWGELKDLATSLLGKPDKHQLPGNVRSPRTLTRIVNNSWDLYKSVEKIRRPRGHAEAEVPESDVGNVLWVDMSEAPDRFYEALAAVPGAVVVVPDVVVPPEIAEACARAKLAAFSAVDAKGLDFRVVAVVGVGRTAAELRARVDGAPDTVRPIAQRLAVDAIRVALSRSTETLILAERTLGSREQAELRRLCSDEDGNLLEGVVTEVPVAQLSEWPDFEEEDRITLVTDLLDKFDGTFINSPESALIFAYQARERLGVSNRSGAVQGRLRERVYEAHARALLRTAIHASLAAPERADRFAKANRDFHLAKLPAMAQLALDARDVLLNDLLEKPMDEQLRRLVEKLESEPGGREDAAAVLALFADRVERASPPTVQAWARLLNSVEAVDSAIVPNYAEVREEVAKRIAAACLRPDASPPAIKLAQRAMKHFKPTAEMLGLLAEHEGRRTDAIDVYRRAGLTRSALRVSREDGGDSQRSLELARELGDQPDLSILERMAAFTGAFNALPIAQLTKSERETLLKLVRTKLAA